MFLILWIAFKNKFTHHRMIDSLPKKSYQVNQQVFRAVYLLMECLKYWKKKREGKLLKSTLETPEYHSQCLNKTTYLTIAFVYFMNRLNKKQPL